MFNSRLSILLLYFVSFCALGCLFAYPAYQLIDTSFERALSRSILVCAVLLFYPAYKLLNLESFNTIGFPYTAYKTSLAKAWLLGLIMLLPVSGYFIGCGFRLWEPLAAAPYLKPLASIATAIIAGLIIGLIEETLFRGLMQTILANSFGLILGLLCVNFVYSSVHFLTIPEDIVIETANWFTGFSMFFAAFSPLGDIQTIWDSWFALFAAGLFLSFVRLKTNNLMWCIGIHAGWVAHIKIFKGFTDRDTNANCADLAGSYDRYVGELSLIWILLVLAIWGLLYMRKTN